MANFSRELIIKTFSTRTKAEAFRKTQYKKGSLFILKNRGKMGFSVKRRY